MPLPYAHPYKYAGPLVGVDAPALFTPADLNLELWIDPRLESTITEAGGAVSQIDDLSGNARNFVQATGADQPTTGTQTINGLNVLDCINNEHLEHLTYPVPVSGNLAMFVVHSVDVIDNAFDSILSMSNTNDFQYEANNASQFDGELNVSAGIGGNQVLSGGPYGGVHIHNVNFDWTNSVRNVYVDGVLRTTNGNYLTNKLDASMICKINGNRSATPNSTDGKICEVVFVQSVTQDQREKLEGYFAWKWNQTAKLSTAHPYKSAPPRI